MTQSQHRRSTTGRWSLITVLVLAFLGFTLRLYRLDAQSIWWDEAISVHLATSSLADVVANRAGNLHPPLYFLLLKSWVLMAGDSPFSVRFLSAWFSVLLIPGLYAFCRRWLSRRAGLLAASLAAFSPLYLAYAQETRVYALLPIVYLALLALSHRLTQPGPRPRWRNWLILALVEVLALGLHYTSLFAVAYILANMAIRLYTRRWADLARLAIAQGLVALLLLPWLLAVLLRADALTARLGMSNWQAEPTTLAHYFRLLWTFQLTGLTALIADPAAVTLTGAVALALVGTLAYLMASPDARRDFTDHLLDWLVPLLSAFVVWYLRPLSHPRYIILLTPALLLLVASVLDRLLSRPRRAWILAFFLAAPLVTTFALGLCLYHTPRFAKDDTEGVATRIAARATGSSLVLVPAEDWSVPYYYEGSGKVEMVWPSDAAAGWEWLSARTKGARTVFLVDYYRATRDPRTILPFALESAGNMSERWDFRGLYVRLYRLNEPVAPPRLAPAEANFSPLHLVAAWIEPNPTADTGLTAALRWRLEAPAEDRYSVNLRLRDLDGWELSAADAWLLNERGHPTDRWAVGEEATTYHVLPLVPGTPPLTYTLSIGVYAREADHTVHPVDLLDQADNPYGQSYNVGVVRLAPATGQKADPYRAIPDLPPLPEPVALVDGLWLEAAALDRQSIAPGQSLFAILRWRATDSPLPDLRPSLTLDQADHTLLTVEDAPAGGRYPTSLWQAGETVLEHRRLTIPPTAIDGPAVVTLVLEDQRIVLGSVEIAAGEHVFTPPPMADELGVRFGDVAELIGYDLVPGPHASDRSIPIILYWRALEGAGSVDYTMFTHVLDVNGHLIAQHDAPPVGGSRPTTSWLPGEIIADQHEMTFRETYTGQAWVEVGLYDPATMERLPTEIGETFVLLPPTLTITGD